MSGTKCTCDVFLLSIIVCDDSCVCVCGVTSPENLDAFAEQMLGGQLKPYLKSEPVPTSNDGPVKVSLM